MNVANCKSNKKKKQNTKMMMMMENHLENSYRDPQLIDTTIKSKQIK